MFNYTGRVVASLFSNITQNINFEVRDAATDRLLRDFEHDIIVYPRVEVSVDKSLVWTYGPYQPQVAWDIVERELAVSVSGARNASNIQLADFLDPNLTNLTVLSSNPAGCTALPCTLPTLAPWTTARYRIATTVSGDIQSRFPWDLSNAWRITTWAIQTWLVLIQDVDTATIAIAGQPDLFVANPTITSPIYDSDDTLVLTFDAWNSWNVAATWSISITIPASLAWWFAQPINGVVPTIIPWWWTETTILWAGILFQPWTANTFTVNLTGSLDPNSSAALIRILWSVGMDDFDPFLWSREATLTNNNFELVENILWRPDLALTKYLDSSTNIQLWDSIVYQVSVTNSGTALATWLTIEDTYDATYFDFDAATTQVVCPSAVNVTQTSSTPTARFGVDRLPVWCTVNITLSGTLASVMNSWDVFYNTWNVTSPIQELHNAIANNTQVAPFIIAWYTDVSVQKTLSWVVYTNGDICSGQTCPAYGSWDAVRFTIEVTNDGNLEAVVDIQDFADQWFTPTWIANPYYLLNLWIQVIPAFGSRTYNVRWIVTQDTPVSYTNTVRVIEWSQTYTDTATWSILWAARLSITKDIVPWTNDINDGPYYPWDEVYFAITIRNTWTRTATWIRFDDIIPQVWWNNIIWLGWVPLNNITIVSWNSVSFVVTWTVLWNKGQYIGTFSNQWVISDPTNNPWTRIVDADDTAEFTIYPRTELAIQKTYLGMNANPINPQDPYGNRYGNRQQVSFRLDITNTWNTQATWVVIQDVLPSVLNFISTDTTTSFDPATLRWSDIQVAMDWTQTIYLTAAVNTDVPQSFVNTSRLVTPTTCTPWQTSPVCTIVITPNDTATWNILWMAQLSIQKTNIAPYPTRVDPRNGTLDWPALPGDTMWFRLTITNTWTRVATWIQLSDLFPEFVQNATFPTMQAMRLGSYNATNVTNFDWDTLAPTRDLVAVPANSSIDVIITWVRLAATWVDVWTMQTNTADIFDPLTQSWVVIVWSTPTQRRQTTTRLFPISEYMAASMVKTVNTAAWTVWVLSWDNIMYSLRFENVGNTWMFFMLEDILPDQVTYNPAWWAAIVTVPNNTPWWFFANWLQAIWTQVWTNFVPVSPLAWGQQWQSIKRFYGPSKFLPVNSFGVVPNLLWRVNRDNFASFDNEACIYFDDIWLQDNNWPRSFRGQTCDDVTVSARARLEFAKRRISNNPENGDDQVWFVITITNTGFAAYTWGFYIIDTFDPFFRVTAATTPNTPTIPASNVLTRERSNVTIPWQQSLSFYITWTLNDAWWDFGDEFQNEAIIKTSETGITLATVVATWVIWQPKLVLSKQQTRPNPYIPWDIVTRRVFVANNGTLPAIVQFRDIRPSDLFESPQVSLWAPSSVQNTNEYIRNNVTVPVSWLTINFTWVVRNWILPDRVWSWYANTWIIVYWPSSQFSQTAVATGRIEPWMWMSVTKTALQTWASLGDTVSFEVAFRNTWNVEIEFDITDLRPWDEISFVQAEAIINGTTYPWNYNSVVQRVAWTTWELTTLLPWESWIATIQWTIIAPVFNCIDNSVEVQFGAVDASSPLYGKIQTVTAQDAICADVRLWVEKRQISLDPQRINDPVGYEIIITNSWSTAATNVWILDSFPPEMIVWSQISYRFSGWVGNGQAPLIPVTFNNAVLWSGSAMVPTIPAQSTLRLFLTWIVNDTSSMVWNSFVNRVCVRPSPEAQSLEVCDTETTTFADLADIYVQKRLVNNVQWASWYAAVFELTVWNQWNLDVTWVTLTDALSSQLIYSWDTLWSGFFAGKQISTDRRNIMRTWLTLLANDANQQIFYLTSTTAQPYPTGTVFSNQATVTMPLGQWDRETIPLNATPTNNIAIATWEISQYIDYAVSKLPAVQYASSWALIPFQIIVSWDAQVGFTLVRDILPAWISFVSSDRPANLDSQWVYWILNWTDFVDGVEVINMTWRVSPTQYAFGQLQNTVEVTFSSLPYDEPPIRATSLVLPIADLYVTKELVSTEPQAIGDQIRYRLTVQNRGWVAAQNVVLYEDDLFQWTNFDLTELSINGSTSRQVRQKNVTNVIEESFYPQHMRDFLSNTAFAVDAPFTLAAWEIKTYDLYGTLTQNAWVWTPIINTWFVITSSRQYTGAYASGMSADLMWDIAVSTNSIAWIPDLFVQKSVTWSVFDLSGLMLIEIPPVMPSISWDNIYYALAYGNSGTQMVSGWTITDVYPSQLSFVSMTLPTGLTWTVATWTRTITITWQPLGSGSINDGEINFHFKLNSNYLQNTCFTNTGSIALMSWSSYTESTLTNNTDGSEQLCVMWRPDLRIQKTILTWQSPMMSWDTISYNIAYGNSWTATVTGRSIRDILPREFRFVSTSSAWQPVSTYNVNDLTWTWWDLWFATWLAPSQWGSFVINGVLSWSYPAGHTFSNTWFIWQDSCYVFRTPATHTIYTYYVMDCNDFNLLSNQSSVSHVMWWAPDMRLTKTHSWIIIQTWDVVTYNLAYQNVWTLTATWPITITDYLPSAFAYVPNSTRGLNQNGTSVSIAEPVITPSSTGITLRRQVQPNIAIWGSGTLLFDVRLVQDIPDGTILTNTARITPLVPELETVLNTDTDTIEMWTAPWVSLQKVLVQNWTWIQWDVLRWRLDFANSWLAWSWDSNDVVIVDTLPTGFTFTNASCSSTTHPQITCSYNATTRQLTTNSFYLTGQTNWSLFVQWSLNFQPLTEFCFTNTWNITAAWDLFAFDNMASVRWCMTPDIDIRVTKTAHPERLTAINPSVWLDVSWSYVRFDIDVRNEWAITVSGIQLTDMIIDSLIPLSRINRTTIPTVDSNFTLNPWDIRTYTLTGIINTRPFGSFTNRATLEYGIGQQRAFASWTAVVFEPWPQCGNYLLERWEQCEQLAWWWMLSDGTMYAWQVCRDCHYFTQEYENVATLCSEWVCLTWTVTWTVPSLENISITKTAIPGSGFTVWDSVWFEVRIENDLENPVNNIVVQDYRPDEIELESVSITPSGIGTYDISSNPYKIVLEFLEVPWSNEAIIRFEWKVTSPSSKLVINRACVQWTEKQKCDDAEIEIWCKTCQRNVSFDKSLRSPKSQYASGDSVLFDVTVTNNSQLPIQNVKITDLRPSTFITYLWDNWVYNWSLANGRAIGTLNAGQSATVTLSWKVATNTTVTAINTWNVSYTYLWSTFTETDTAAVPIWTLWDLQITKTTQTVGSVRAWDEAVFVVQVRNTSTVPVNDVKLTDARPSNLINFVSRNVITGSTTLGMSGTSLPTNGRTIQSIQPWAVFEIRMVWKVTADYDAEAKNTATITYTVNWVPKTKSDDATIVIIDDNTVGVCESLTPKDTVINIDTDRDETAKISYTCEASDDASASTQITIDCDNGDRITKDWVRSLRATCEYDEAWTYKPTCIVNNNPAPSACQASLRVRDENIWVCGNGRIDAWEKCDLGTDDADRTRIDSEWCLDESCEESDEDYAWMYCQYCDIEDEDETPVVESPQCFYSDVPMSLQPWEILPLRWNVWYDEYEVVNSCGDADDEWKIVDWTVECRFRIYNKWREDNGDYITQTDWIDCTIDRRSSSDTLFDYFRDHPQFGQTVQYADGKDYMKIDSDWDEFGEYKVSLDEMRYEYCDTEWDENKQQAITRRVCQANFALTKPYLMQKWASTSFADTNLEDFYTLPWQRIIDSIQLDKVQSISENWYKPTATLVNTIDDLITKYDRSDITTTVTIDGQEAKKVRGKDIYIVENWTTIYTERVWFTRPITVIAKWDLTIIGDVAYSIMFVVKGNVSFVKEDCSRQVINWIVMTQWSFTSAEREKPNTQLDQERCVDWWLTIKWLLIWQDIEAIFESKRSNLNDRFRQSDSSISINEERRKEIYDGAAVLIEHNPALRLNLPPLVNEIWSELQFFRK